MILARSSVNRRGVIKMDFYVKRGAKKGDRLWFLHHVSKKIKGQIEELVLWGKGGCICLVQED